MTAERCLRPPCSPLLLLFLLIVPAMALGAQEPGAQAPMEPYEFLGRFVSRGELTAPPTALGARALLPSADRRLYLVEPGGELLWRAELGGKAIAPVTPAAAGTIAVVTDARELILLDGEDGRVLWRKRIPGPDSGRGRLPALLTNREGTILLAEGDTLSSFSLSGSLLWKRALPSPLSTSPLSAADGTVLLGTEEGRLTAYSADGALRWTTLLEEAATDLAEREGRFLVLQGGRELLRFDPEGRELGKIPLSTGAGQLSGPLEKIAPGPEGRLILLSSAGGVVSVDREGEPLWSAPGATGFAPAPEGVLLSFPGGEGELRSHSGRLLWELESEGAIHNLLSLRGSMLIVFGDWVVSWYRGGERSSSREAGDGAPGGPDGSRPLLAPAPEGEGDLPLLFRELFRSPSRRDREQLLRAIEERDSRHDLAGVYRGIRELTLDIALEPQRHPRGGEIQNDFPDLRARAATLLGGWGDLPSWNGLLSLLREEREAPVVLSALRGLSEIPYDREGAAALTLVELAGRWEGAERFPEIAEAILDVLGALRTAPGTARGEAYATIATAAVPRATRARAMRLMSSHFENPR